MMKRGIPSQRDHILEASGSGARRLLTQVVRTSRLGNLDVSALLGEIIGYRNTASVRASAAGNRIHDDERVSFHPPNRDAKDRLNRSSIYMGIRPWRFMQRFAVNRRRIGEKLCDDGPCGDATRT